MKSYTFGYFLLSVVITVILFMILAVIFQFSADEGLLIIIGIIVSLQLSFLTGWTINKLNQIQRKR
ncbi:hypothetical protein [Paenibacillus sp. CF384]|uniref:hypothetical protein n=1 Tax=Paenibacillus sp. CF384 TaxID=1884382 RepID=UPI0008994E07|nr:hypothetical protein [Paenibacillus sp. CF384]SDW24348.1 hypothetical protein SAMN05518855_1001775 [Paenibacillus sp. CF384]